MILSRRWFARDAVDVARDLIGCTLVRQIGDQTARGMIVETEAYQTGDPAMHGYRSKTKRNAVMFGPAGYVYVYLIYGIYHCFNVVTGNDGEAGAVLIRALEFDNSSSWLTDDVQNLSRLAAGPGKLCAALDLTVKQRGLALGPTAGIWITDRRAKTQQLLERNPEAIVTTTRIGLTQGVDRPWRWYLRDSPAVSKR